VTAADIAALRALMAKATPGPWATESEEALKVKDSNGDSIAMMYWTHLRGRRISEEVSANASLIAAAVNALPALLSLAEDAARMRAALEAYLSAEPQCKCNDTSGCPMAAARAQARAALAPPEEQARAAYLRDAL